MPDPLDDADDEAAHTDRERARRAGSEDRAEPQIDLEHMDEVAPDLMADVVRRLSGRESSFGRYELKGEIARGGQGVVYTVRDTDLRRDLAMKVIVEPSAQSEGSVTPRSNPRTLGRFLEEAQVTGQLDHPGIVPIHELGLDDEGRIYFTMKLVRGRDLARIFELVREGDEDWSVTRALGLMLQVCEAMAYAHHKRVIHRDLKPANVMVGRFGAVYVMDWGLARVLGHEDQRDLRVVAEAAPATIELRSERREQAPDSDLMTMDGDVIGTPIYMSPEQAMGQLDKVGPATDVYAVGAMLYHLLAGQMPYAPRGKKMTAQAILRLVQSGPPKPLNDLVPQLPGELVAICEQAMSREPSDRYEDMGALADDLRAFLEGRVVKAYGGGAVAEAKKWVQRNTPLAASLGAAVLLLVGGLAAVGYVQAEGRHAADAQRALAEDSERRALANEALAAEQARLATERAEDVLSLSALQELDDLVAQAEDMWPAAPDTVAAYEAWLERTGALVDELPRHRRRRTEIRSRALPVASSGDANGREEGSPLQRWSFESSQDRWWHAQLTKLIEGLDALADPRTGWIAADSTEHGWGMERRLEFARTVEERTLTGATARQRWDQALASIRDIEACPLYAGLVMPPQLGLLPMGRDPQSGLWEFWHVLSGDEPRRDDDGRLVLTENTGVVLVLLPGGRFGMGAQSGNPRGRNYHPAARAEEGPVHELEVSPFFLSKYELTQGQWKRFTLANPSLFGPDGDWGGADWSRARAGPSLVHPVEQVDWNASRKALLRMGLELPSEAQWEYGARAGTSSAWWTGPQPPLLKQAANLGDKYRRVHGGTTQWDVEPWDDGSVVHAAVGSYRPNTFGLHDVIGNVWEWCLDGHAADFYQRSPLTDPVLEPESAQNRVFRGGGFYDLAVDSRSSSRDSNLPDGAYDDIGIRPARPVDWE